MSAKTDRNWSQCARLVARLATRILAQPWSFSSGCSKHSQTAMQLREFAHVLWRCHQQPPRASNSRTSVGSSQTRSPSSPPTAAEGFKFEQKPRLPSGKRGSSSNYPGFLDSSGGVAWARDRVSVVELDLKHWRVEPL